jgi:hypothetical protein
METVQNLEGLPAISPGGPTGWSTGKRDDQGRDDLPALFSAHILDGLNAAGRTSAPVGAPVQRDLPVGETTPGAAINAGVLNCGLHDADGPSLARDRRAGEGGSAQSGPHNGRFWQLDPSWDQWAEEGHGPSDPIFCCL